MKYCRGISFSGNSKQRRKKIRHFLRKNAPFFELRPCRFRKEGCNFGAFEVWQKEIQSAEYANAIPPLQNILNENGIDYSPGRFQTELSNVG